MPLIIKELANVGAKAQANIDATAKSLASITGVPEDVTKVSLTRPGLISDGSRWFRMKPLPISRHLQTNSMI